MAEAKLRDAHAAEPWRWVYDELLRIEAHRTEELQNEQHRVGSVLAVNGFLFALLAAGGIGEAKGETSAWDLRISVLGMCILAVGLAFGLNALRPRTPIRLAQGEGSWPAVAAAEDRGLFLNANWLISHEGGGAIGLEHAEMFEISARALAKNIIDSDVGATLAFRRRWIRAEVACIALSLLFVGAALVSSAI